MRHLRSVGSVILLASWASLLAGCSSGGGEKPQYLAEGTTSLTATVDAIDYPTRTVTLEGESGNKVILTVDDRVKNFDKIKVGDRVRAGYYESVDIEVRAPGEGSRASATATNQIDNSDEGPGGVRLRQSTVTALVNQVDKKKGVVVLKGPTGELHTVMARDRSKLENVEVGDEVVATYTEALAVAIDPVAPQ